MCGVNLRRSNTINTNLSWSILDGADLRDIVLEKCDLTGVDISKSIIKDGDMNNRFEF